MIIFMVEIIDPHDEDEVDEELELHTVVPFNRRQLLLYVPSDVLTFLGLDRGDGVTWLKRRETLSDGRQRNFVKIVKR